VKHHLHGAACKPLRAPASMYDLFFSVFVPLVAGLTIYRTEQYIRIPAIIRYYLPDGLWAYAFGSCMLIVWDRRIKWPWIIAAMSVSIVYEACQYYHVIPGVGELRDVMTYLSFFSLALLSNCFLKRLYTSSQNA
jgi:hypothetical protein